MIQKVCLENEYRWMRFLYKKDAVCESARRKESIPVEKERELLFRADFVLHGL